MTNSILLFIATLALGLLLLSPKLHAGLSLDSASPVNDLKFIDGPIVAELFTSQSCSSCPEADKVLSELAQNPNVIAISCHVTYWNHLHWKDTLSLKTCTERQQAYAAANNTSRIYTPQMVINGEDFFVGSRRSDARQATQKAKALDIIPITYTNGTVSLNLQSLPRGSYQITIFGTKDTHKEDIPSGENRGRLLAYHHSATMLFDGGTVHGDPGVKTYELSTLSSTDRLVAIVQRPDHGAIIAVGALQL